MNCRSDRWLAAGLVALAGALGANSLLGPLVGGVMTYPVSETVLNQTIGLEAVSLLVVAPLSLLAAALVVLRHRAGPFLALPPSAYAAYMFAQYVVGPQYQAHRPTVLFHLVIFILSGAVLLLAWQRTDAADLPERSQPSSRIASGAVLLLAVFTLVRYLPDILGSFAGAPIPAEYSDDPSMYWSIFLLDLGVVVPVTVAVSVGLFLGTAWAQRALYGVVGWFSLVPISVSAMGIAMLVNDDPNAAVGNAIVLSTAALLFVGFSAWVYRPLLSRVRSGRDRSEGIEGAVR